MNLNLNWRVVLIVGGFSCSCVEGYVLRPDKTSCKALGQAVRLIFANRVDIRQVSLFDEEYTSVIDGLQNAIALDFDYRKGLIIWSDVTLDAIKRAYTNGTGMSDVIWWGLKSPGGVAIDWIHDHIYWTDSGVKRVEVSNLDGSVRRTLVWENVEKPRAIAVHPGQAAVVWTDWGSTQPRIERCDMDGSNRYALVTDNVVWPNGLTIDYAVDHVYWADAKHHVIESVRLDGTGRRRVIDRGLPHPFAISIFEDSVFWTDWHTKSIHEANKLTGHDIHSIHPLRQPDYTNRCGSNNGGCSHLCLPNRSGYSCACPAGLSLTADGQTCSSAPGDLLIFAQKSELRLYALNASGETDYVLPLSGVRSAVALDWDGASQSIFWTDVESDVINRAFWNGSNQQTLVANDLESPAGSHRRHLSRCSLWSDMNWSVVYRFGRGLGHVQIVLDGCRNQPDRSGQFGRIHAQSAHLGRSGPAAGHCGRSGRRIHVLDGLGTDAQDRTGRNGRNAALRHRHEQFDVAQRTGHRSRRRAPLLGGWRHQSHRVRHSGRKEPHHPHRSRAAASVRIGPLREPDLLVRLGHSGHPQVRQLVTKLAGCRLLLARQFE